MAAREQRTRTLSAFVDQEWVVVFRAQDPNPEDEVGVSPDFINFALHLQLWHASIGRSACVLTVAVLISGVGQHHAATGPWFASGCRSW